MMDPIIANLYDLSGRIAVVTGRGWLAGENSFSLTLARAGAVVVVADLNQKGAEVVVEKSCGGKENRLTLMQWILPLNRRLKIW